MGAQRDEMLKERDALLRQLLQIQDDRRREQLELRATVVELQAQLSHASLARPEQQPTETGKDSANAMPSCDHALRSIFARSTSGSKRNASRSNSSPGCRDYGAGPARDEPAWGAPE